MHRIGFILFPNISTMCLAVTTVFEMANWELRRQAYQLTLASEHGGLVPTSVGYEVQTVSFKQRKFDTVIVAGEHEMCRCADAWDVAVSAGRLPPASPDSLHLHGCIRACASQLAGWTPGDYALEPCETPSTAISEDYSRRRSHLHDRRVDMDIGGNERGG